MKAKEKLIDLSLISGCATAKDHFCSIDNKIFQTQIPVKGKVKKSTTLKTTVSKSIFLSGKIANNKKIIGSIKKTQKLRGLIKKIEPLNSTIKCQ